MRMSIPWRVEGIYYEACNCDAVCPCYSALPPTYGYCEGNCAWHVAKGHYGDLLLDDLNVVMVQRTDGLMRETPWKCWFYIDSRADPLQFDALTQVFTGAGGGHLGMVFEKLWQVQGVEPAEIHVELSGWQHKASIPGRLGLAIGRLLPEAGPTLCRLPNVPGLAALAEEDWLQEGSRRFDYRGQNALTTTFTYERL